MKVDLHRSIMSMCHESGSQEEEREKERQSRERGRKAGSKESRMEDGRNNK